MNFKAILVIAALSAILLVPAVQANVLFSHPYDPDSDNAFSSFYYPDGEGVHQSFADYYWDGGFTITDFHWWGIDWGQMDGFVFQIYDQSPAGGLPGTLLYEEFVGGNANSTFVENNSQHGYDIYSYWFDLATPFTPAGSGYLWFSVYAVSDYNWFWAQGGEDPFQYDWQYYDLSTWQHFYEQDPDNYDGLAFEITGRPTVPEPTTLALFGIGLAGLAARRLRRKK